MLLDLGFEETKIFVPSRIQENTEIQIKRVTKEALSRFNNHVTEQERREIL